MSDDNTPVFPDGIIVKAPHANAPDFIKCRLSLKRKDLGNWLRGQTDDWINLDVKVSRDGKWYCMVDDWKPDPERHASGNKNQKNPTYEKSSPPGGYDDDFEDIPFMRPHDEYFG